MKIKSQKDFFSGLMFTVVGMGFAWGANQYPVGTGARMGPGYFPMLLGIVLAVLGGLVMFNSLIENAPDDGDEIGAFAWKPLCYILGANLLFGICLGGLPSIGVPPMGLIAGIYALTIVASLAGEDFKLREVLVLATILAIGSYLAFVSVLKLQMPVWPAFIAG